MKIAIIEPYLVDYTGHYYNFVTELRRGFGEIDKRYIVDVFVPKKCTLNDSFKRILPFVGVLSSKNYVKVFFNNVLFFINFRKILHEIDNDYDVLVFTTADGFRLLFLLLNFSFKKPVFLYSHMFFSEKKQMLVLALSRPRKDNTYFLTPFGQKSDNISLIESLRRKHFDLILDVPYPFCRLNKSVKKQSFGADFYILYLGPAREEKGFVKVVEFIGFCKRNQLDYKFILQCSGAYEPNVKQYIHILKSEHYQKAELIEQPLPQAEYESTIQRSSILLLLYDPSRYVGAISGVLLEALSLGKPVVVLYGTWLADQVQKYGGGVVISESNPENIKAAVEKVRLNYEKFTTEAFKAGEELSKRHNGIELARIIVSSLGNCSPKSNSEVNNET